MKVSLYGIPNCDTVRKARRWLADHNIDYEFQDFKQGCLTPKLAQQWLKQTGAAVLINRRGTSWRKLSDTEKAMADAGNKQAAELVVANPSLIKRPVLLIDGNVTVGFSEPSYAGLFTEA